eukprot:CAMPEP_0171947682 /NCGR_PEP_ID=MMETSP0993-20121228/61753_1 /TAXON_ID=483369 /ORGANISM="non described non described, Strain CCMP2098" /LENGTH=104 /DNA_ID=CAMNT_0012591541 /DNA_START=305 /DNA_END=616 /DNA_ORIENTATION=-
MAKFGEPILPTDFKTFAEQQSGEVNYLGSDFNSKINNNINNMNNARNSYGRCACQDATELGGDGGVVGGGRGVGGGGGTSLGGDGGSGGSPGDDEDDGRTARWF